MKGYYDSVGMHVGVWDMALWGIPTAICAFFLSYWRFKRMDKRIERAMNKKKNSKIA
jgi:uncharacterized membrane protein